MNDIRIHPNRRDSDEAFTLNKMRKENDYLRSNEH